MHLGWWTKKRERPQQSVMHDGPDLDGKSWLHFVISSRAVPFSLSKYGRTMERGDVYIETLYEGRGLPLCLEASREKKHNSLRVLWFPPSQVLSAAGSEAGISISEAGGGQRYCSATIITLTVCPDISTLVYLSVYWYVVLEWRDSMEKSPNLWWYP